MKCGALKNPRTLLEGNLEITLSLILELRLEFYPSFKNEFLYL